MRAFLYGGVNDGQERAIAEPAPRLLHVLLPPSPALCSREDAAVEPIGVEVEVYERRRYLGGGAWAYRVRS